jgi:isoquinoline 1-oxidoreductase beta subunit
MEPMNATARFTPAADGRPARCEVWVPTQNGDAALAAAAESAGLPPAQCEVYKLHLGGGFGRRGAVHDFVRQAVAIARQFPGTPVKLLWSREEDMTHGQYHPVTMCKLTAGLDSQGRVDALHMRISGQSILAALFPQNVRDGRDRSRHRLRRAAPAGGPCDAQSACAARLLARREPEPEHAVPGVFPRRGGKRH